MVKGTTRNFWPGTAAFHIQPADASAGARPVEVRINDLKAMFVVHSLKGNPRYVEQAHFLRGDKAYGRKLQVTFKDGELLEGTSLNYDPSAQGFFVFPADRGGNNDRIYVVNDAVMSVRLL